MKLTDILPTESWRQFTEEIYEKFGVRGLVNNKDGTLLVGSEQWGNQICPQIAEKELRICATAYYYLSKLAQEKKEPAVGECDIGFTKILVPIFHKEEFLGSVGACGLLTEDAEVDTFYIAESLGLEETAVEKQIAEIKRVSPKDVETVLAYIKKRLKEIIQSGKD